jgi:hypothetical protein
LIFKDKRAKITQRRSIVERLNKEEIMTSKLIEILKSIESDASIVEADYLTDGEVAHPLVLEAVSEACGELITARGSCNWGNHQILSQAGFRVRCGEKDSFGWLTGMIVTKKGLVVYG